MDRRIEDILVETRRGTGHLNDRELLLVTLGIALYNNDALTRIESEIHKMADTIVSRKDLDAAIANLLAAEAARDQAVTTALNDLGAKIAAGEVTTPEDFSAELAQITTLQSNAAALTATATADDPGPTTVPTTPIAPDDPAAPDAAATT